MTLIFVKPGLIVKTLARKIHVHSSPYHDNDIFRPEWAILFFKKTLLRSIDAKIEIGANCETFWRSSP